MNINSFNMSDTNDSSMHDKLIFSPVTRNSFKRRETRANTESPTAPLVEGYRKTITKLVNKFEDLGSDIEHDSSDESYGHNDIEHDDMDNQINQCDHDEDTRKYCHRLRKQYLNDPDNNSSSLQALESILKLPPIQKQRLCRDHPMLGSSHEDVISYLNQAWDNMEHSTYGHFQAKNEIIEYLVAKIFTKSDNRVIGLVGPPGIGKTTMVVNGIVKALGLPFYQMSVGGLRDVTFFNGNQRCWKGAHQGVFADILIKHGRNAIIYIDELDKVVQETANDIYGILTHAIDPITNTTIKDQFLGIDLDLSGVTFILSYNDSMRLTVPLRNRIKEINLNGFSMAQKKDIVRDYIIPECLSEFRLSSDDIIFSDQVISHINHKVSDDSDLGVRNLKKCYKGLMGKILINIISNKSSYSQLIRRCSKKPLKNSFCGKKNKGNMNNIRFNPYGMSMKLPYTLTKRDVDKLIH